jgi:glycosyltransferase involved in cell wall biosynthesis
MIVRNEERNLPACLGSVAGVFDEVIVLDTGSTDRTREIAREHGARVFDFVWVDDFGAARNAALARATGDFAFWLDADDVIEPPERLKLERLLASLQPNQETGFVVRCSCDPDENGGGGQTVVDHVRLFPVREDVRWTYRIHEQILPALRAAGVPVRWTDILIRHTGYSDSKARARKLDRDEQILRAALAEEPDEPFVLFNLGSIANERQDWRASLKFFQESLAHSRPDDSITRKSHAMIARAYQGLGDLESSLKACDRGLAFDPDDAELLFRKAVTLRQSQQLEAAEACWRRILLLRRTERFSSVDQGIYGHLTRRNLASLAASRGDWVEALHQWRGVLGECPGDPEALVAIRDLEARGNSEGGS